MVPKASGLTTRPLRPKVRKEVSFMGWCSGGCGGSSSAMTSHKNA
jgi:hypothetical protein